MDMSNWSPWIEGNVNDLDDDTQVMVRYDGEEWGFVHSWYEEVKPLCVKELKNYNDNENIVAFRFYIPDEEN